MWDIIIVIDFVMFLAIMGGYEQDMFGFGGCVFRLLICFIAAKVRLYIGDRAKK